MRRFSDSLSGLVEDYLKGPATSRWLERLEPTSQDEVSKRRPEGFNTAWAIREARRMREDKDAHGFTG